jgi:protein tyrosine phosphatase (PTP) superfamily phosphohydrolase (DUF442 family)
MLKTPQLLVVLCSLLPSAAFAFGSKPISVPTQVITTFQGPSRPTEPVTRNIYRGSYPSTDRAVQALANLGIHTVIDLQGGSTTSGLPGESAAEIRAESDRVQRLGMRFFNLPVTTFSAPTNTDKARVIQIAAMMDDPQLQPVFVHCDVGVDRTGLVVAAYRILYQGCSFSRAYQETIRKGKLWTPVVTAAQISFLQYLEKNQRAITGALRQSCPLW